MFNFGFFVFFFALTFLAKTRHKNWDNILKEQVKLYLKLVGSKLWRAVISFYWPKYTKKTWILAFLSFHRSNFYRQKLGTFYALWLHKWSMNLSLRCFLSWITNGFCLSRIPVYDQFSQTFWLVNARQRSQDQIRIKFRQLFVNPRQS